MPLGRTSEPTRSGDSPRKQARPRIECPADAHPGDIALGQLIRLLARQAALEWSRSANQATPNHLDRDDDVPS